MRIIKIALLLIAASTLTNCASGYKVIEPKSINYVSMNEIEDVKLEYQYELLDKKYAKKEAQYGIKLVAIKITNNSGRDVMFGRDVKLIYEDGREAYVLENQKIFKTLKQRPASYLWYLLLTPLNLYVTETGPTGFPEERSSTPIGLVLGPGMAGGNMIAASSANKKFRENLLTHNINGEIIKKGETKYGLVGIRTESFHALRLKIE